MTSEGLASDVIVTLFRRERGERFAMGGGICIMIWETRLADDGDGNGDGRRHLGFLV